VYYETFNDFIHIPGEEKRDGSYIGIAIKVRNTIIGNIDMDNSAKYRLSVDGMDFMAILSHQLAAGIEKSRLFEKIQQLSQHDGLTGRYNHRMFLEKIEQEINRPHWTGKTLLLMMLDIDHFKQFNDNFGHQVGMPC
jgi:predicted signal transduction protein with EAL and GGDEF domain